MAADRLPRLTRLPHAAWSWAGRHPPKENAVTDVKLLPTARETLLQLMAEWLLTTGRGSREQADAILGQHAAEVLLKAAELAEGSNPDRDPDFTEGVMWVVDLLRAEANTTPA